MNAVLLFCSVLQQFGDTIPTKANFFITYIMLDGWAGSSWELIRIAPLIVYHVKNAVLVRTPKDRDRAMAPGNLRFNANIPRLDLYFLLGSVYCVMTPMILPFILVFFGFGYLVFRNQVLLSPSAPFCFSKVSFFPLFHSPVAHV